MAEKTRPTDEELILLIRDGDEAAFVTLYRRLQGGIFRFVLRMSGSESVAEDVVQEVFLSLMHGLSSGAAGYDRERGSLSSYLFGIARNQVLRRFEKERLFSPLVVDDNDDDIAPSDGLSVNFDPVLDLSRREMIDSVRHAVLALPVHYREAVVLCDLHEMSYADAAMAIGCKVGTVRSRLHRGRALLVEKLKSEQLVDNRPGSQKDSNLRLAVLINEPDCG